MVECGNTLHGVIKTKIERFGYTNTNIIYILINEREYKKLNKEVTILKYVDFCKHTVWHLFASFPYIIFIKQKRMLPVRWNLETQMVSLKKIQVKTQKILIFVLDQYGKKNPWQTEQLTRRIKKIATQNLMQLLQTLMFARRVNPVYLQVWHHFEKYRLLVK